MCFVLIRLLLAAPRQVWIGPSQGRRFTRYIYLLPFCHTQSIFRTSHTCSYQSHNLLLLHNRNKQQPCSLSRLFSLQLLPSRAMRLPNAARTAAPSACVARLASISALFASNHDDGYRKQAFLCRICEAMCLTYIQSYKCPRD